MTNLNFSFTTIILDACCVLNLYASKQMEEIITALPASIAVAENVCNDEALWIYNGPDENIQLSKEPINLKPLKDKGLLTIATLDSEAEETTAVNYTYYMKDDGESVTAAIAVHRNWAIATDDRRAISFLAKQVASLTILSTLDLVKFWADTQKPSSNELRFVLQNISMRATYKPHQSHSLYTWWQGLI